MKEFKVDVKYWYSARLAFKKELIVLVIGGLFNFIFWKKNIRTFFVLYVKDMKIKFLRSFTYLINAIVSVCKLQNIKLEVDAVKQIQTILVQETQLLKLETVLLFP